MINTSHGKSVGKYHMVIRVNNAHSVSEAEDKINLSSAEKAKKPSTLGKALKATSKVEFIHF